MSAAAAGLDGGHAEGWSSPAETEAAGLDDEAKTEAWLATEHEGTGGTESIWEDA